MRFVLLISLALLACGPKLPSFSDVQSAPARIQSAARAVVRIQTAGQSGTGVFISGSGLLLTNNHVLGAKVCPVEGCFFRLNFQHQLGVKPAENVVVFGIPQAADVGRDIAIVQVFTDDVRREMFGTADFVTPVETATAASLVGTTVYVVGHPESRLKKWTQGTVVDATGDWFETTSFILPGSSGSAVLNENGELVGLMHRGSEAADLISSTSYDFDSIGTAASAIVGITTLPSVMLSTHAGTTVADLVDNNRLYLNGKAPTATVAGAQTQVLDALANACDAALARTDYASPDDLTTAMQPCRDAMVWIECRTDVPDLGYGIQCPLNDQLVWTARYQKMNTVWHQLYGGVQLAPLSFGVAAFGDSMTDGMISGQGSLQAALADMSPPLDFNLALELSAFDIPTYQGHRTVDEVQNYASTPGYAVYGTQIADAALWLRNVGLMTNDEMKSVLNGLLGDPSTSLSTRLLIEDQEYLRGILQ
jgi:V8-like Glu-specific endopeptidase